VVDHVRPARGRRAVRAGPVVPGGMARSGTGAAEPADPASECLTRTPRARRHRPARDGAMHSGRSSPRNGGDQPSRDEAASGSGRPATRSGADRLARRWVGRGRCKLVSTSNLAVQLRILGDYSQARALQEDALERWRKVLGDDHPSTLASAANLAVDFSMTGQHEQARTLHEETLARRRRVFGDDHPSTRGSARDLSYELAALGDTEQAEKWRTWAAGHTGE